MNCTGDDNAVAGRNLTTNWTNKLHARQEDGNSCGLFVIMAMICILKGKDPTDCIQCFARNGNEDRCKGQLERHWKAVACSAEKDNLIAFELKDLTTGKL